MGCDQHFIRSLLLRKYFNPRSPSGLRPHVRWRRLRQRHYFNPRSPSGLRRGTFELPAFPQNFNPRSPSGLRQTVPVTWHSYIKFQSTQPEWAATVKVQRLLLNIGISIHAARVGCDTTGRTFIPFLDLFQSTQPEWAATGSYPSTG